MQVTKDNLLSKKLQKNKTSQAEKVNAQIQSYLQKKNEGELLIIKTAFNKSIFSS